MSLRPYLLGAVALALAGVVVWDYWPEGPARTPVSAPVVAKPVAAVTLNPLSQRPKQDFAALFDHPLFDPTRTKAAPQPLPVAGATTPVEAEAPTPVPLGPAHPVLMGTVTSPWPGGVYLGDDQGGPVVFLRPGQQSRGLHLEEARANSAIFMGPDGEITLNLQKADPTAISPAPDGTGVNIPAPDPNTPDPNTSDLGAMAPGAVDPSMTDPGAMNPEPVDPGVADPATPNAPASMPEAIAPKMPAAP